MIVSSGVELAMRRKARSVLRRRGRGVAQFFEPTGRLGSRSKRPSDNQFGERGPFVTAITAL
jgi:hypothetical protein